MAMGLIFNVFFSLLCSIPNSFCSYGAFIKIRTFTKLSHCMIDVFVLEFKLNALRVAKLLSTMRTCFTAESVILTFWRNASYIVPSRRLTNLYR